MVIASQKEFNVAKIVYLGSYGGGSLLTAEPDTCLSEDNRAFVCPQDVSHYGNSHGSHLLLSYIGCLSLQLSLCCT